MDGGKRTGCCLEAGCVGPRQNIPKGFCVIRLLCAVLSHPVASVVFAPNLIQSSGQQKCALQPSVCIKLEDVCLAVQRCFVCLDLFNLSSNLAVLQKRSAKGAKT